MLRREKLRQVLRGMRREKGSALSWEEGARSVTSFGWWPES